MILLLIRRGMDSPPILPPEALDEAQATQQAWAAQQAAQQAARLAPVCVASADQRSFQMNNAIIGNRYHLIHGIGRGKFGKVYEARDLHSSEPVAVKVIVRIDLNGTQQMKAEREWRVASKLTHPNIIQLRDVQVSEAHVFLVMEMASGNELFDRVSSSGGLGEDAARRYFQQVLSGIAYCHQHGVYHRDLKLENLLMASQDSDQVKIMDFGLSKDSTMSHPKTYCGTISYMAPEVTDLQDGKAVYDGAKADIWSLGVILFVTVCCAYPFGHDGRPDMGGESAHVVYARIRQRKFKEPGELERCSGSLRDLISGMLTVEVSARLSLAEIVAHPWMQAGPSYEPDGVVPLAESPRSPASAPTAVSGHGGGTGGSALRNGGTLHWPPMHASLDGEADEYEASSLGSSIDMVGSLGDSYTGGGLLRDDLDILDEGGSSMEDDDDML
eukprot:COSAG05_NODE_2290_length_3269_cov_2.473186_2_plen_443_part_00